MSLAALTRPQKSTDGGQKQLSGAPTRDVGVRVQRRSSKGGKKCEDDSGCVLNIEPSGFADQ